MVEKRKIIFRADGGPTIGMGHFIRTLALAEMLKDDFYCIYASQSPTPYQIREIEKVCHERIDLPADDSHFTFFLNQLKGDEIVVLDNYYFTTEYQKAIKEKGCKLACIDDMHDKHFVADLVINHAEGIDSKVYSFEKYTSLLLGYPYALLRKEYLTEIAPQQPKLYSCLVMMGGADPDNITTKVTILLNDLNFSLPIAIVVGDSFAHDLHLNHLKNVCLFKGIPPEQIYQIMQQSQFGILPASTVAIEACAARLPFICGYFIDNQKEI
jgi:UDP-2,4-diacetamido-2,4,6-trideoxy-beta-L-altropyranose hydrolase